MSDDSFGVHEDDLSVSADYFVNQVTKVIFDHPIDLPYYPPSAKSDNDSLNISKPMTKLRKILDNDKNGRSLCRLQTIEKRIVKVQNEFDKILKQINSLTVITEAVDKEHLRKLVREQIASTGEQSFQTVDKSVYYTNTSDIKLNKVANRPMRVKTVIRDGAKITCIRPLYSRIAVVSEDGSVKYKNALMLNDSNISTNMHGNNTKPNSRDTSSSKHFTDMQ